MEDLAQQLQALANKSARSLTNRQDAHITLKGHKSHKYTSFLWTAEKSAEIDSQTIYLIGLSGLDTLALEDDRFNSFRENLFHTTRSKASFTRVTQSEHVLKKMNTNIDLFLELLTPFFLMEASHKVLEFLIRRYEVHVYNISSLMKCALPYIETNTAARLFQILALSDPRWRPLLKQAQERKAKLSLHTLLQGCMADTSILEFVANMAKKAAKLQQKNQNFKVVFNLYASVVVQLLPLVSRSKKVNLIDILPTLLPGILRALRMWSSPEFQAAGYLNNVQLCRCAERELGDAVVSTLLESHVKKINQDVRHERLKMMLQSMAVVIKTQNVQKLPQSVIIALLPFSSKLTEIDSAVILPLIRACDDKEHLEFAKSVLKNHNDSNVLEEVCKHFFDVDITKEENQEFLRFLQSAFSSEFDKALRVRLGEMSKKQMRKWLKKLESVLKGTRNEVVVHEGKVRGPLAFSLNKDKNNTVRLTCAETILDSFSKGSIGKEHVTLVTPWVLQGLQDSYDEVVKCILGKDSFFKHCSWELSLRPVLTCMHKHEDNLEIVLSAVKAIKIICSQPGAFSVAKPSLINLCFAPKGKKDIAKAVFGILQEFDETWKKFQWSKSGITGLAAYIRTDEFSFDDLLPLDARGRMLYFREIPKACKSEMKFSIILQFLRFLQEHCLESFHIPNDPLALFTRGVLKKLKASLKLESNEWFAPIEAKHDALSCLQQMYLFGLQDSTDDISNHTIKHLVHTHDAGALLPFLSSFLCDSCAPNVIESTLCILHLLANSRGTESVSPLWCFAFSLLRNPESSVRERALNLLSLNSEIWDLIFSHREEIIADASVLSRELPSETIPWVIKYIGWLPPRARYAPIIVLRKAEIAQKSLPAISKIFSDLLQEVESQTSPNALRNEALAVCTRIVFQSDGPEVYALLERYLSVLQSQNFLLDESAAEALKTPIFKLLSEQQRQKVLQAMTNIWRSNAQALSMPDIMVSCIEDGKYVLQLIDLDCPVYSNVLELLRVRPTQLQNHALLVAPLFRIVKDMNQKLMIVDDGIDFGFWKEISADDLSALEYQRRTALSILTDILRVSSGIGKSHVDLEAIVSCVKFHWPQHSKTRTAALRLLSRIALVKGLESSVFNAFVQILDFFAKNDIITNNQKELNLPAFQQILLTSIPQFPRTNSVQETLMLSLVNALQKVHFETQTPVINAVIDTINQIQPRGKKNSTPTIDMLPRTIAMILATHPVKAHTPDSMLELCNQILLLRDPVDRIKCLNNIVDNTYWGKKLSKSRFYAELECLSKISTQEASTLFKSNLADLMVLQLNQDFGEDVEKMNDQSLQLFKKIFVVLDDMGRKVNDRFSGVAAILEESLNILMRTIPIKQFAKALARLFGEKSAEVRLRAVALACEHAQEVAYTTSAQRTYLQLLPRLEAMLLNSNEINRLKQNVILYLETMLSTFEDDQIDNFETMCSPVIQHVGDPELQKRVFSFFTAIFKTRSSLPIINMVCPKLTEVFSTLLKEEELSPGRVHGYVEVLAAITAKAGMFVTRYVPDFISVAVNPRILALGKEFAYVEVASRDLVKNLSKVEARHLVPVMTQTYDSICSDPDSLIQLFRLVTHSIGNWDKKNAQTHHAELYLFLIKALDLRSDGSFEMTPEVEDSVINSFLGLVLKLKPSEMQALFKRFIEWVGIENTSTYHPRSLTFFRFMQAAMTKFQKLFSPFFSMSFQLLISCLKETYEVNEEEEECLEEPPRKRRKLNSESQREFMKKRQTAILRSSEIFFTLEEENTYMNKGAFNLVLEPLCQQLVLARILQPEQEYLRWAQTIFIPTVVAFAETTAEDVLLMALNGCLVKHSRSSSVEVRLASVETITKLFQVVRIRYLSCLPETLVALDELLQDSDDRMEDRTKALIEIIEELTGERIEDHMT